MKVKKPVKKAQNGAKRADSLVTEKKLLPKFIDLERARVKGPSEKIDTAARNAAVKRKEFYEDPKSGDLFPVKKKAKFGAKMVKKAIVKKVVKSIKKSAKKK
jgi:hypothetical protein